MKLRAWLAVQQRRLFFYFAYWGRPRWDTGVTPPELLAFTRAHPPGRALDLGCGTGTNAVFLAQHGWEAWGVDFSGKAMRAGIQKARQAGLDVHLRQGDVSKPLNVPGLFDLVLDIGCLHVIPKSSRGGYLKNLSRLLAPGGHFLLYGFLSQTARAEAPGLSDQDIAQLTEWLTLESRSEGIDANTRASTWLLFRRA